MVKASKKGELHERNKRARKAGKKVSKGKIHNGKRGAPTGNVAKYTTRNKALNRLQIKLGEFRRLCILKGIHPREPKKKFEGHNKTYYHVKDINFLAHEPLLEKSREIRVYEKKIVKARAKRNEELARRLIENRPAFSLDHLVRERYPSFIDALRDLDDPLTMIHLFATLPADKIHKIPVERVHSCRRLSLEWQAYITRTHSLRKVFVSVKGIYYQAEVSAQKITWLTPHVLHQVLPEDVDFRVMLTFAEFYETLMGFVNFKLYHSLGLRYPPVLDPRLEQAAAELYALMKDLAGEKVPAEAQEAEKGGSPDQTKVDTTAAADSKEYSAEDKEKRLAESQARLASLQDRLSRMAKDRSVEAPEQKDSAPMETEPEDEDEETRTCRLLFKDVKFFLGREVPREALLFVIRAFGGAVSWDGEGAPFPETDEDITHQIVDRPVQGHKFLSREYVQPQWVFDCANHKFLLPTESYLLGRIPPPHLSPFVNNEEEGHIPDFAKVIESHKQAANKHVLPLPGAETELSSEGLSAARRAEDIEAAKERELATLEKRYAEELAKEISGKSFSEPAEEAKIEEEEEEEEEEEAEEKATTAPEMDEKEMAKMMLSRNKRQLYKAMQMGKAKKRADVEIIKKRKKMADEATKKVKAKRAI